MANSRKVISLYSGATSTRVTLKNYSRVAHSVNVRNAVIAATRRLMDGNFARCDIYNEHGLHTYSLVYTNGSIRISYIRALLFAVG
jgi:hypothetical protein